MAENSLLTRYKADNSDFVKKTKEAQRALDQFGVKGTEIGSKISRITDVLNINVGALSKLSVGLGAAGAALKVAGDAFKQSESFMDEWGQTVESAKSLYDGFLNAINTGNISGYLRNINNIVDAAKAAYNAMDDLGTFNAFNQINEVKNKANFTEAVANFKAGTGSKESVLNAADAMKRDLQKRRQKETEEYLTRIDDLAASRQVNRFLLRDVLMGSSENFERVKNLGLSGTEESIIGSGTNARLGTTQVARTAMEKIGQMLRDLNDEGDKSLDAIQAIGKKAELTGQQIADVDKQVARYMKEGAGGSGGGKGGNLPPAVGSMDEIKQNITDLNKQLSAAVTDEARRNIRAMIAETEERLKGMQAATQGSGLDLKLSGASAPTGTSILAGAAGKGMDLSGIDKKWQELQKLAKAAELAKTNAEGAANAFSAIGSALSSIEDPAAKVMGILAMAIANMAATFAKSLEGTFTPWDWIAGAAAGTATLISSITAIQSVTSKYANGGEIKGNSYSGDNLLMPMVGGGAIAVNAGEYVFNRAQLGNLAGQLSGGSQREQVIRVRIENNELVGTLRNANARAGYHA